DSSLTIWSSNKGAPVLDASCVAKNMVELPSRNPVSDFLSVKEFISLANLKYSSRESFASTNRRAILANAPVDSSIASTALGSTFQKSLPDFMGRGFSSKNWLKLGDGESPIAAPLVRKWTSKLVGRFKRLVSISVALKLKQ